MFDLALEPLRDARGQTIGIACAAMDVTDRARAQVEQETFRRNLQETQKLESLGVLAGGIAHDFNNLLTAILGSAGLARMELPAGAKVIPHLEQIEAAARR